MRPLLLVFFCSFTIGCWDLPPGNVPLSPDADNVEIVTETPNLDTYESFDEVTVEAIGKDNKDAQMSARHALRNRAAQLHARFVTVDDASASFAWDFSGRTIVTLRGRVFRVKEEEQPAPRR